MLLIALYVLCSVFQPAPTCGASDYPTVTARDHLTAMAISKSKEARYKRADAEEKIG